MKDIEVQHLLSMPDWMTSGTSLHSVRDGPWFGSINCNADGRAGFFSFSGFSAFLPTSS